MALPSSAQPLLSLPPNTLSHMTAEARDAAAVLVAGSCVAVGMHTLCHTRLRAIQIAL